MEKYIRTNEKLNACRCLCIKLKQLPFSLMYLLFRQNDCLYCKLMWNFKAYNYFT